MKILMRKMCTLILIMSLTFLLSSCGSRVSKNVGIEVSYERPEINKNTNIGAELPYIEYESEHKIIFSHNLGIFIFDLDNSKMLRAIKLSDSKIHIGAQGDTTAVIQVDTLKQTITIYEVGSQHLDYYYKYDINADKLYKYPIGELDTKIKKPEITGRMDTKDWTAWDLYYTSHLTEKIYYPFRDIIE